MSRENEFMTITGYLENEGFVEIKFHWSRLRAFQKSLDCQNSHLVAIIEGVGPVKVYHPGETNDQAEEKILIDWREKRRISLSQGESS